VRALLKERLDESNPSDEKDLFAAVVIPDGILTPSKSNLLQLMGARPKEVEYWSINQADFDLRDSIRRALDRELQRRLYATEGLDEELIKNIQSDRVPVVSLDPKKKEGEEEVSLADTIRQYVPIGFVYLLWISLMSVVQMLLNNTVEEKSNRIVEVLLSSVTAGELMAGKLFGIACVGFTMLFAWIAALLGILHWHAGPEAEFVTKLLDIIENSGLLWIFLAYFLMAYLLYSGIFLAIGSVCSTIKDAQNFMGPVMIIMMVPLLTMMFIPKDPHGTLATVLSWIPIYTPFVMLNRAAANPPLFDIVGTTILGFVSVVVVIWLAGKVFRTAILRTGQAPRLVELWRWLKG
ncbi:MAG: ABC transporter permease, partial [Planctomycetota bacterium]|nr:ABC transporter permease [Planctomycetota bacterium]